MKPIKTDKTNAIFKKEGCGDLPATVYGENEGTETCWELSEEELEEITKTKKIYLYILGGTVPPVALESKSFLK